MSPRISNPAKSGSRSRSPASSSDSGTSPALLSSGLNLISINTLNRRPNRQRRLIQPFRQRNRIQRIHRSKQLRGPSSFIRLQMANQMKLGLSLPAQPGARDSRALFS